ncbi:hypothetical protein CDL15_Pgr009066 [Punica granatum]|uniref:Protein PLASTID TRANSCRIPTIONALLY ACTIVE 10 n=1 Tax=Punica granatum TaxID=22663 RepID=A0A218VYJ9_PUNGR|nr:hypothetical protein CDL15_Pgr009066 [Punica granatum]
MQFLQTPRLFSFLPPPPPPAAPKPYLPQFSSLLLPIKPSPALGFPRKCFASDEFPVDETFLQNFGPKDKETEDQARRRNWIERGWAPWEEVLSPEADFARKSLNEGEEVPLQSPEAIEAFRMLNPNYRAQRIHEMGLTEDDWYRKQFEIKGEIPEELSTVWAGPVVVRQVAPRDWPPRGWEVDKEELRFIREGHKMLPDTVDLEDLDGSKARRDTDDMCLERYKVFLKQYQEWVDANSDRLDEESYKCDQDYHPGRRKRGKDYKEGLYELPFYYPGQAKRDPYRFRFPIEMRFVHPNIDHLIFNRFDFPPIFHRDEDTNLDELRRDCGRPPVPRKDPGSKPEKEPLLSNHPYVDQLWQIHVAEQMILDDLEMNPEKYKDKKLSELVDDNDFDEENSVEYSEAYYKKTLLPKMVLKTSVKELDLEAALAEREYHNKLRKESMERGERYKISKLRRNIEMDDYDLIHWQRSYEEREALLRDISCRQALGLPLEEPGRYVDAGYFGKDQYDPANPLYRYDYWGEPKNSEKSKQERMTDAHNKSIVGKGIVWYEMPYEDVIKQKMQREANPSSATVQKDEQDSERGEEEEDDDDDDDDDDDFDYSILGDSSSLAFSNQPLVNGTESSRMTDEGMFEE